MAAASPVSCPRCNRAYTQGEQFCPSDGTSLRPAVLTDPVVNTVIDGRYRVIERIGKGGMGVVYKGVQSALGRDVAIKVLSPAYAGDEAMAQRFKTEAEAASRLKNPHTVTVYDAGATDTGLLYLVMELLDGEPLRRRLTRAGLSARAAVKVAADVCESLAEAHACVPAIVHRDIKPDNIFVRDTSDDVQATVLDFGLARFVDAERSRITSASAVVGSPPYMSPEQCQGAATIDARSDLYSLGILLFEMLTGRVPFTAPESMGVLMKHVHEAPPSLRAFKPDLEMFEPLEEIVASLLAKSPGDRPRSGLEVRGRLVEVLRRLPQLPLSPGDDATVTLHRRLTPPAAPASQGPAPSPAPYSPTPPTMPSPHPRRGARDGARVRRWATLSLLAIATVTFFGVMLRHSSKPEVAVGPPPSTPAHGTEDAAAVAARTPAPAVSPPPVVPAAPAAAAPAPPLRAAVAATPPAVRTGSATTPVVRKRPREPARSRDQSDVMDPEEAARLH
jgi:serine/threonine-protein kinase